MAINPDIRDQAYQFFIQEAPELLQVIEAGLLTLRQERNIAKVHDLMRAAHSVKGGASSVGLEAIATLAHRLENIFKALYSETLEVDAELEDQLLQAYDCLRLPLMIKLTTGSFNTEQALAIAEPIFSRIEERCGDALTQTENYIPSSSDLGIDMISSILEIDVAQGLEHLAAVVANPQIYEVVGELRAQVEVFAGFAELMNLSSFEAIAETVKSALDANPDRVLEITRLAIADFERSRQAVLASGVNPAASDQVLPSAALIALTTPVVTPAPISTADSAVPKSAVPKSDMAESDMAESDMAGSDMAESDMAGSDMAESGTIDSVIPLLEDIFGSDISPFEPPITVQQMAAQEQDSAETTTLKAEQDNGGESVEEYVEESGLETSLETGDRPTLSQSNFEADENLLMGEAQLVTQPNSDESEAEEPVDVEWVAYLSSAEAEVMTSYKDVITSEEDTSFNNPVANITSNESSQSESPDRESIPDDDANSLEQSELIETPEALEAAVQSIEQIFDRLPLAQNLLKTPISSDVRKTGKTPPSSPHTHSNTPSSTPSVTAKTGSLAPSQPAQASSLQVRSPRSGSAIQPNRGSAIAPNQSTGLQKATSSSVGNPKPEAPIQQGEAVITSNITVRVSSERLERMNNMVGELAINRDGLSLQNEQLQSALRELLSRFARFQDMVNHLRGLSDQMLIEPERRSDRQTFSQKAFSDGRDGEPNEKIPSRAFNSASPTFANSALAEFDPLEMDSYSVLHTQIQEILEDIAQLEETVDDVALFAGQSNQILGQQQTMLTQLRDELVWARMFPLGEVLNRFPRMIRDLSITHHKPVALKLSGTSVLVDKAILEKLFDPLLHLLRNAFDHGIESVNIRRQQGKPEQGQIEVQAYHKGNQTIIQVKDDGQGLDLNRIRNRAIALGWLSPEQLAVTNPSQLYELIFEPGFSTAQQVTELSGRGVGLDVVRSQLRSVKGTVTVTSTPGRGTIFTLYLPLTLTIAKLVICLVGSTALSLPADSIEEILTPQSGQVQQSGPQRYLNWREQIIPTYRLSDLLSYTCPLPETLLSKALSTISLPKDWALPMLILRQDQQIFALEVDRLVTEQELVIKPFGRAIAPPKYAYGCTTLGDGSLVPVIDGAALLALSLNQLTSTTTAIEVFEPMSAIQVQEPFSPKKPPVIKTAPALTVMVIDDSATLRRTVALSLERAGFRVLQARDGREAIDQLQHTTVQGIVCDIEMPNMNGFEFLSHRRKDAKLANIPVVMLTSRGNEKHRWLASQLGASAYFTKPYLEQEFLTTLKNVTNVSGKALQVVSQ